MHTQERQLTRFLYFTTDLQRKPNRRFFSKPKWNRNRTKPAAFLKTEPKPNQTWKIHSAHPYCSNRWKSAWLAWVSVNNNMDMCWMITYYELVDWLIEVQCLLPYVLVSEANYLHSLVQRLVAYDAGQYSEVRCVETCLRLDRSSGT